MSKILDAIIRLGGFLICPSDEPKIIKRKVSIDCKTCGDEFIITAGAVYRQLKRGNKKYICKSCAGKKAWNKEKRDEAKMKSTDKWHDPDYSGTIVGKALAREIKDELDNFNPSDLDI